MPICRGDLPEAPFFSGMRSISALVEQHAYGIAQTSDLSEVLYQSGVLDDAWRMALHVRESRRLDFVHSSWRPGVLSEWLDLHRERNELDACRSLISHLNALRSLDSREFLHLIILLPIVDLAISRRDLALAKTTLDEIGRVQFRIRFPSVLPAVPVRGCRHDWPGCRTIKHSACTGSIKNERILRNRNFLLNRMF